MTRVLVTGGAGMIGSNLVRRLVADGARVTVVDNLWRGRIENFAGMSTNRFDLDRDFHERDLSRPSMLDDLLGGVDYVFHLADVVAGVGFVFANQLAVFRQNLLINTHVVESVARAGRIRGYIYPGTACSFPQELQTGVDAPPLREQDLFPASPESAYGWSKLMGQYEATLLEQEHGVPVCLPMLHNVYGSPCDYSAERSQVIPALVRRAIEYRKPGDFVVWGDGTQGRAFVHVDDVIDGLIAALERGLGHSVIQIGPTIAPRSGKQPKRLCGRRASRSASTTTRTSRPATAGAALTSPRRARCSDGDRAYLFRMGSTGFTPGSRVAWPRRRRCPLDGARLSYRPHTSALKMRERNFRKAAHGRIVKVELGA